MNKLEVESCKRKKSFDTMNKARNKAALVNKYFVKEGRLTKVRAYKCPVCGKYHLTSSGIETNNFYKKLRREREEAKLDAKLKLQRRKYDYFHMNQDAPEVV